MSNNAISVSYQSINPIQITDTSIPSASPTTLQADTGSNVQIFDNGLGRIVIPNNTSYIKFTIYQKSNNSNSSINMSGLGDLLLRFTTNTGESLEIDEFPSTFVSKAKGEVVFRITENQAKNILGFANKSFNIFLRNDKNEETFLYSGKFYSIEDYQTITETDEVSKYQKQVADLNSALISTQSLVAVQQQTITSLTNQNTALASNDTADSQKIAALSSTINNLNQEVSKLSQELALTMASLQNANGLPKTEITQNLIDRAEELKNTAINAGKNLSSNTTQIFQESKLENNKANIKSTNAQNFNTKNDGTK